MRAGSFVWRLVVALLLFASAARASEIFVVEVRGPIFAPVHEYLKIALEQAEAADADALLFELDTPGGSLEATKGIVQEILGAPLPVIVYVAPSGAGAISAGTFVTLAAHVAAMAPGTTIGAAHPVAVFGGGGEDGKNATMEKKVENYAVSFIEAIAAERGRNVAWAAEAVRDSSAITADVALEKKVIDLVAGSRADLLEKVHGKTVRVAGAEHVLVTESPRFREVEMTLEQSFYFFLSQPTLIFILLVVGIGGLYLEFTNPGLLLPGVVGAIALLLAMIGFSIVPINYTGAALLALGTVLLAAEVFVPSFGALGIGGLACLVVGSLLLFETREAPGVVVDRTWIAATAVVFGGVFLGVSFLVARSFGRPVETGIEGMIGRIATAREPLAPRGTVRVSGEIWDATVSGGTTVEKGEEVVIVALEGLRLVVEPRRRA